MVRQDVMPPRNSRGCSVVTSAPRNRRAPGECYRCEGSGWTPRADAVVFTARRKVGFLPVQVPDVERGMAGRHRALAYLREWEQ